MEPKSFEWMRKRACNGVNPHMFFSELVSEQRKAQKLCTTCLVQAECLQYALEHGEKGVWGGTTERERRKIKKNNRNY